MIIGNNHNNGNNFNQQKPSNLSIPNTFENRWNEIKEYNNNRPQQKNIFVKDIQEQKYASTRDTQGIQDRSLAMLQDRLEKGTISLEEFNRKCAQLGEKRQNLQKNNKLF